MVQQVSVFLENKKGRIARVAQVLAEANVNLITLMVADTAQFGLLRCLVDDPQKAVSALGEAGFMVNNTPVLACEVPDRPGGLAGVMEVLSTAEVSVEYLYSFARQAGEKALMIFQVDRLEAAEAALCTAGYRVVDQSQVTSY